MYKYLADMVGMKVSRENEQNALRVFFRIPDKQADEDNEIFAVNVQMEDVNFYTDDMLRKGLQSEPAGALCGSDVDNTKVEAVITETRFIKATKGLRLATELGTQGAKFLQPSAILECDIPDRTWGAFIEIPLTELLKFFLAGPVMSFGG